MAFKQKGFPMHSGTSAVKQVERSAEQKKTIQASGEKTVRPYKKKPVVNRRKALMDEMATIEALEKKAITDAGQKRLQQISDELTEMDKSESANVSKKVEASSADPKRTVQASGEKTVD